VIDDDPFHPDSDLPPKKDDIQWLEARYAGPESEDVEVVDCWRCGREVEATYPACPFCRARLASEEPHPSHRGRKPGLKKSEGEALTTVIYFSLALFATSVVFGWMTHFALDNAPQAQAVQHQLVLMTVVEVVDAVLVLAAIFHAGRPPALSPISLGQQVTTWLALLPVFALLLAANFTYHHFLKDILHLPQMDDVLAKDKDLIPWVFLTICVQPAIVEELFFRYLALGHFRHIVGDQGAVWLSAAMFGLFHIFNPLGMPYLILAGAFFGYARLYSRSMALPMLLHLLHNVIVLWFNPWP
jgi:uncharacterized protein